MVDAGGLQLGERKHIDWVIWDIGRATTFLSRSETRLLEVDFLAEVY